MAAAGIELTSEYEHVIAGGMHSIALFVSYGVLASADGESAEHETLGDSDNYRLGPFSPASVS